MRHELSMMRPLIHIGYHKTGTTWLQHHLFDNGPAGYVTPMHGDDILRKIVVPKTFDFDAAVCRRDIDATIARESSDDRVPVISAERLSGNPHSGGYDAPLIAARLHDVFPDGRILIVIREQAGAIASCYNQYVKAGGIAKLQDYLHPPSDFRFPTFDFNHFDYRRLITHYHQLFGSENVLVLLYEQFVRDPMDFVARLNGFAGIRHVGQPVALHVEEKANTSLSGAALRLQRLANHVAAPRTTLNQTAWLQGGSSCAAVSSAVRLVSALLPASTHRKYEERVLASVRRDVGDRYASANSILSERIVCDLATYGYSVSRPL